MSQKKIWEQVNKNSEDIKNIYKEKKSVELEKHPKAAWWQIAPIIVSIIGVIVSGIIWKINADLEKKLNNRDSYYESLVVNMKFSDKYETGLLNIPNNEDPIKVKYKTCDAYSLRGSIKEARVIYYTENNIIVSLSNLLQRDIFEMKQNQNNYAPETIFLRTLYTQDVSASSASNYYSSAYLLLEDYNEKKELFLIAYCFDKEKKYPKDKLF